MLGLYDVFAAREARLSPPANPLAAAEGPRLPPEPRLQVHPIRDLRELRAAEDKLLDALRLGRPAAPASCASRSTRAIDLLAARQRPAQGRRAAMKRAAITARMPRCGRCVAAALVAAAAPAARRRAERRHRAPPALRDVGIDQRLDEPVPLDLPFRDEAGETVTLGSLLRGKPVILALVYYECPMLCTLVLNGLVSAMKALPFDAGEEFDVITVSFDPRETPALAAAKKETYLEQYRRARRRGGLALPHRRRGVDRAARRARSASATATCPSASEFAHAAGIIVLTPQGSVARYFYGVEFAPRDLRFGLIEAAENRIGSPVDQLLLFCFHYDPEHRPLQRRRA